MRPALRETLRQLIGRCGGTGAWRRDSRHDHPASLRTRRPAPPVGSTGRGGSDLPADSGGGATARRASFALHLLGVIAHQVGRCEVAVDLITKAIALAPGVSDFHSNLGIALQEIGKLDEATAAYRRAIVLKLPITSLFRSFSNLWQMSSGMARAAFQLDESHRRLSSLLRASRLQRSSYRWKPTVISALPSVTTVNWTRPSPPTTKPSPSTPTIPMPTTILPVSLQRQGGQSGVRPSPLTVRGYRQPHNLTCSRTPHWPLQQPGQCLCEITRPPGRGLSPPPIVRPSRSSPTIPDVPPRNPRQVMPLKDQGQLDAAIAAYRQAIALQPDYFEVHSNLGLALQHKGQLDEMQRPSSSALRRQRWWPPLVCARLMLPKPTVISARATPCEIKDNWTKPSLPIVKPSPSSPTISEPTVIWSIPSIFIPASLRRPSPQNIGSGTSSTPSHCGS